MQQTNSIPLINTIMISRVRKQHRHAMSLPLILNKKDNYIFRLRIFHMCRLQYAKQDCAKTYHLGEWMPILIRSLNQDELAWKPIQQSLQYMLRNYTFVTRLSVIEQLVLVSAMVGVWFGSGLFWCIVGADRLRKLNSQSTKRWVWHRSGHDSAVTPSAPQSSLSRSKASVVSTEFGVSIGSRTSFHDDALFIRNFEHNPTIVLETMPSTQPAISRAVSYTPVQPIRAPRTSRSSRFVIVLTIWCIAVIGLLYKLNQNHSIRPLIEFRPLTASTLQFSPSIAICTSWDMGLLRTKILPFTKVTGNLLKEAFSPLRQLRMLQIFNQFVYFRYNQTTGSVLLRHVNKRFDVNYLHWIQNSMICVGFDWDRFNLSIDWVDLMKSTETYIKLQIKPKMNLKVIVFEQKSLFSPYKDFDTFYDRLIINYRQLLSTRPMYHGPPSNFTFSQYSNDNLTCLFSIVPLSQEYFDYEICEAYFRLSKTDGANPTAIKFPKFVDHYHYNLLRYWHRPELNNRTRMMSIEMLPFKWEEVVIYSNQVNWPYLLLFAFILTLSTFDFRFV